MMHGQIIAAALLPLAGALIAGFGTRFAPAHMRRALAHWAASASVAASFLLSAVIAVEVIPHARVINFDWFIWAQVSDTKISVGFLVDNLTVLMMLVVTFVSLMVHIYTIGYMHEDDGYCRFFAYIALFTFAMLMLVMANNFMQLFFGWEAVGVVSYLLIGFWYKKPTAIFANLKAFLVNRVGDFGFLLGIGLVLAVFGSLDYAEVFADIAGIAGSAAAGNVAALQTPVLPAGWDVATTICLLLFVGAMGKSAQFPLHVWLPDSMEGPTPISALIHAATMVTAGIFMVARLSPLFELSVSALTVVLYIGTITAFFMGLLGLVQNDIKRVVAYSTLSQLGYMTAALGLSAYSAAIFHLFTHAFFKALLFLAAGSVIIALHHQQDMRKMGGLSKKMPITYTTALLGTLALIGAPPFSGFFSKDMIIEAARASALPYADFVYGVLVVGAFITALYSLRLLVLVFHGRTRMDAATAKHAHETPWVVTAPLVLLALPSMVAGGLLIEPLLFGEFFTTAVHVDPARDTIAAVRGQVQGSAAFILQHSIATPAFWASIGGAVAGVLLYRNYPHNALTSAFAGGMAHRVLLNKYGIDDFNNWFWAGGVRRIGRGLWRGVDGAVIDGVLVGGLAKTVVGVARWVRQLQSGAIYHYAFLMIVAVAVLVLWRRWLSA